MIRRIFYVLLVTLLLGTLPTEAQTFYTVKYQKEKAKKEYKKLNKSYYKAYRKTIKRRYKRHYSRVSCAHPYA
jgi:hypothetical protein